jgi:G3E family GTPase
MYAPEAASEIQALKSVDALLVELDPADRASDVLLAFDTDEEGQESPLSDTLVVDTRVTVVDASNFPADFWSAEELSDRGIESIDSDQPFIPVVLALQIEDADVVVLNKCDLVDEEQIFTLEGVIRALNPAAVIVRAEFGRIPVEAVVKTGLMQQGWDENGAPTWMAVAAGDAPPPSQTPVGSLVFSNPVPFHPERFWQLMHEGIGAVIRSQGHFWIASRPEWVMQWAHAGSALSVTPLGLWSEGAAEDGAEASCGSGCGHQHHHTGKENVLFFLGEESELEELSTRLEKCVLTAVELEQWKDKAFVCTDPFPEWEMEH